MTITLNKSRIASSVIAAVYIAVGFAAEGGEGGLKVLAMVILPLACIWFGDAMGGYTGQAGSIGITAPSPGVIVSILGWLLLLLPIIMMIINYVAA
jgi:hypothetical protein